MLPDGATYDDDRTVATLRLMEYLKTTTRGETYLKYLHFLAQHHRKNHDYAEVCYTDFLCCVYVMLCIDWL